jgi:hypothetical protein
MENNLTFEQFCDYFNKESTCIDALFTSRWPEGFRCPRCQHAGYYFIRTRTLPLYECQSCRAQTSIIAGTIMEGSRTPLRLWFQALFLHAQPNGISALRLSTLIGTTYKTAWLMCHKIRHAMSSADSKVLLSGVVRINCGVYGRPYNPTIFRHPQEQPLLIGASLDNEHQVTHLKIKQVSDRHLVHDRVTPLGSRLFIQDHVSPETKDIDTVLLKFSRNRHRPLIQFGEQASAWMNYVFSGIGPKHLQSYLDQFCFNVNLRHHPASFNVLLTHCTSFPTLTCPQLTSRIDLSAQRKMTYHEYLRSA